MVNVFAARRYAPVCKNANDRINFTFTHREKLDNVTCKHFTLRLRTRQRFTFHLSSHVRTVQNTLSGVICPRETEHVEIIIKWHWQVRLYSMSNNDLMFRGKILLNFILIATLNLSCARVNKYELNFSRVTRDVFKSITIKGIVIASARVPPRDSNRS